MRATFKPDYQDGYDLNDPKQYSQWLALEAERRRTGYYSDLYTNALPIRPVSSQAEVTEHLNKMRRARQRSNDADAISGVSIEQEKGFAIAGFIQSEVMSCDFIDDVPVSHLVLQLKLAPTITFPHIWSLHVPGSTIWVGFSDYFRLVNHAIQISATKHTLAGYLPFCDIDELVSITTWDRLERGIANREDIGNINLPTYGVGAKDSFVQTLASLVIVPAILQRAIGSQGIGNVEDMKFSINDEDFAALKESWNNSKERSNYGSLDEPMRWLLNNRALFERFVNSTINSLPVPV